MWKGLPQFIDDFEELDLLIKQNQNSEPNNPFIQDQDEIIQDSISTKNETQNQDEILNLNFIPCYYPNLQDHRMCQSEIQMMQKINTNNLMTQSNLVFTQNQPISANIFKSCTDKKGSRIIQQEFELKNDIQRQMFYDLIKDKVFFLCTDVFGNYVVQKMIQKGNLKLKLQIIDQIQGQIANLSLNTYGCRVIQKLIENMKKYPDKQLLIIQELQGNVCYFIQDKNGNHVFQKCLECLQTKYLDFVVEEIIPNLNVLSFHPYGCRVIQKILENLTQDQIEPILQFILVNLNDLCQCLYGNYIIQIILQNGPSQQKQKILQFLASKFQTYSMNKYARYPQLIKSNVIEKSLQFGDQAYLDDIFSQLIDDKQIIQKLIIDPFGNYVLFLIQGNLKTFLQNNTKLKTTNFQIPTRRRSDQFIYKGKHSVIFIEKINQDLCKN